MHVKAAGQLHSSFGSTIEFGTESTVHIGREESGCKVTSPSFGTQRFQTQKYLVRNLRYHCTFIEFVDLLPPITSPVPWAVWADQLQHIVAESQSRLHGAVTGSMVCVGFHRFGRTELAKLGAGKARVLQSVVLSWETIGNSQGRVSHEFSRLRAMGVAQESVHLMLLGSEQFALGVQLSNTGEQNLLMAFTGELGAVVA
jgi:hypothetical protein